MTDTEPFPITVPHDLVDDILASVRADLEQKRASGELPHLPPGELDRQFSGVVEAVDAGLVDDTPLDPGTLRHTSVLETWRPAGGGLRGRLTRPAAHAHSRLVGAVVRRQVGPFTERATTLIEQLVSRQERNTRFLTRVHLDRIRTLESRVAELERQLLARTPGEPGGPPGGDA